MPIPENEPFDLGPHGMRNAQWHQDRKDERFGELCKNPVQLIVRIHTDQPYTDAHRGAHEFLAKVNLTDRGDCLYDRRHLATGGNAKNMASHYMLGLSGIIVVANKTQALMQEEISSIFWSENRSAIKKLGIEFHDSFYNAPPRLQLDPAITNVAHAHFSKHLNSEQSLRIEFSAFKPRYPEHARRVLIEGKKPSSWEWASIGTAWLDRNGIRIPAEGSDFFYLRGNIRQLHIKYQLRIMNTLFAGSAISRLFSEDFGLDGEQYQELLENAHHEAWKNIFPG